ncbi:DedA family protein [Streptomyces sedi]|uniref:DedA family protein n=1 Tax=Streptomyces sedi TaxID=555059 RepID=UPI001FEC3E27|nr:DedA family protein [Streptomyces sedi]
MAWLSDAVDSLSALPTPVTLCGAAAFAAAESGLGIGMFIPGETAVLAFGAATRGGPVLAALFLVVAVASSAGDHVGYFLGRRYGAALRHTALVRRVGQESWDRANDALRRYGAWAVFATRLLPLVRTLTPAAAGVSGVAYLRFLPASLAGALMWSALYTFVGALAGESVGQIERRIAQGGWLLAGLGLLLLVVLLLARRRAKARATR